MVKHFFVRHHLIFLFAMLLVYILLCYNRYAEGAYQLGKFSMNPLPLPMRIPSVLIPVVIILFATTMDGLADWIASPLAGAICSLAFLTICLIHPFAQTSQGGWPFYSFSFFGFLITAGISIRAFVHHLRTRGRMARLNASGVFHCFLLISALVPGDVLILAIATYYSRFSAYSVFMFIQYASFTLFIFMVFRKEAILAKKWAIIVLAISCLPIVAAGLVLFRINVNVNELTGAPLAFHDPWIGPFLGYAFGISLHTFRMSRAKRRA